MQTEMRVVCLLLQYQPDNHNKKGIKQRNIYLRMVDEYYTMSKEIKTKGKHKTMAVKNVKQGHSILDFHDIFFLESKSKARIKKRASHANMCNGTTTCIYYNTD